jgi:hypothetical protein
MLVREGRDSWNARVGDVSQGFWGRVVSYMPVDRPGRSLMAMRNEGQTDIFRPLRIGPDGLCIERREYLG